MGVIISHLGLTVFLGKEYAIITHNLQWFYWATQNNFSTYSPRYGCYY